MNLQESINWEELIKLNLTAGPGKIKNQNDQKIRIMKSRPGRKK